MSPEVQALLRLKELEVREIYGEEIERLLDLAEKRARALRQLFYAEEAFRQAIDARLSQEKEELLIKRASAQLREALSAFQQARYPERQEFVPRQQALDADIARAKALQEAIEVWWWRRFSGQVVRFNEHLSLLPEENALSHAEQSLEKAQTVFQSWPSAETTSSWRGKAEATLTKMKDRLAGAKQDHLKVRLREASYWLDQAEKCLPAQENQWGYSSPTFSSQPQYGRPLPSQPGHVSAASAPAASPDPFAALACLTRAEMILDDLQARIHQDPVSSGLQSEVNKAQEQFASLREKAGQYLVRWLADGRQRDFSKAVQELSKLWGAWQRSRGIAAYPVYVVRDDIFEFLKGEGVEARTRRELLDNIRLHLYLDPTAKASDPQHDRLLKELVLCRHDCLLRAQQLLREVKARWNVEGKERRPYIYWAWRKMNEAFDCDPDSEGIQRLRDEIGRQWVELSEEFRSCASTIDNSLKRALSTWEQPGAALSRAKETLDKAKDLLDSQAEHPLDWEEQIRKLEDRLGLFEQANAIAGQWDNPDSDLPQLVSATQSFLQQSEVPDSIRSFLRKHIRKQQTGWSRVRPSLALSLASEIRSVQP